MVVKINIHSSKNQIPRWQKSISAVVKINFSSVTRANFRAGYACTSNALIWLVGIRGKACFSGKLRACLIGLCGLEPRTVARHVKCTYQKVSRCHHR